MLTPVEVHHKTLDSYSSCTLEGAIDQIRADAADLRGARVLHVNATAYGGGVAEILGSLVPLMRDLGLEADWKVISGTEDFFRVTKAMHNALQGQPHDWTAEERAIWVEQNRLNADAWEDYDFVVIHDPQPAPLLSLLNQRLGRASGRWIWRCHIDLTDAQPEAWDLLLPFVEEYDASIWTMREYVRHGMPQENLIIAPPAIDPLSPKNTHLEDARIEAVLHRYGVDPARPIVCQVSRFDPWKDPLGVIEAYRLAKQRHPGLQLVLVASMAHDDPEGWEWYERVVRRAGEDYDIKILSNLNGVGNVEVNAFQRASSVVIQKSLREGFGLVVAEGLWKGIPVVASAVGGIPLQVEDGKSGYLVNTVEECADRICDLLEKPERRDEMGDAGREHVREHFLITRYLHDYVKLFNTLRPPEW
jgi:trehalose synthase